MFHDLLISWFQFSKDWGYLGVFVMMALESTVVPIPSEVILPPAAYWAAQGNLNLYGVIASGALGATVGSSLCYALTYTLGRAFVTRWGRYFLLPPARLDLAERWLAQFALGGVFFARLLPVVRHLIGFPAGLVRVPFRSFVGVTLLGSALWCSVLGVFGARTIGRHQDLLSDPDAMSRVLKEDLVWFVLLAAGVGAGWLFVKWFANRGRAATEAS